MEITKGRVFFRHSKRVLTNLLNLLCSGLGRAGHRHEKNCEKEKSMEEWKIDDYIR